MGNLIKRAQAKMAADQAAKECGEYLINSMVKESSLGLGLGITTIGGLTGAMAAYNKAKEEDEENEVAPSKERRAARTRSALRGAALGGIAAGSIAGGLSLLTGGPLLPGERFSKSPATDRFVSAAGSNAGGIAGFLLGSRLIKDKLPSGAVMDAEVHRIARDRFAPVTGSGSVQMNNKAVADAVQKSLNKNYVAGQHKDIIRDVISNVNGAKSKDVVFKETYSSLLDAVTNEQKQVLSNQKARLAGLGTFGKQKARVGNYFTNLGNSLRNAADAVRQGIPANKVILPKSSTALKGLRDFIREHKIGTGRHAAYGLVPIVGAYLGSKVHDTVAGRE